MQPCASAVASQREIKFKNKKQKKNKYYLALLGPSLQIANHTAPSRRLTLPHSLYMIRENRHRLSLRNNRLKLKTAGKLPIILEEFIEYTPI